ncbi:hypothetical protein T11_3238 [Trichinella zimbabwensis]|uniref:Uncharacterized protein n=1 Tax=Trichinella zimbabwensis TaxID=268475 RepID=A0A0V1HZF7_9BILA|nr:hypothetical protein T11_3238 [Trichinella zimbabwensis]
MQSESLRVSNTERLELVQMAHGRNVIDGGSWSGTGIEDTDGHRLASFTFVPLEQILQHCICAPFAHSLYIHIPFYSSSRSSLQIMQDGLLALMSALRCIISAVALFLFLNKV